MTHLKAHSRQVAELGSEHGAAQGLGPPLLAALQPLVPPQWSTLSLGRGLKAQNGAALPGQREGLWLLGAEGPRPHSQHSPTSQKRSCSKEKEGCWDAGRKDMEPTLAGCGPDWQQAETSGWNCSASARPWSSASLPGTGLRGAQAASREFPFLQICLLCVRLRCPGFQSSRAPC